MDILRKKGEHETEVIKNNFSMIGEIVICNIELENVGLSSICNEIAEFEILGFCFIRPKQRMPKSNCDATRECPVPIRTNFKQRILLLLFEFFLFVYPLVPSFVCCIFLFVFVFVCL